MTRSEMHKYLKPFRWYRIKEESPLEPGSFLQYPGLEPGDLVFKKDTKNPSIRFQLDRSSYFASPELEDKHLEPVPLNDLQSRHFSRMIQKLDWSKLPNKDVIARKVYDKLVEWRQHRKVRLLVKHPVKNVLAIVSAELSPTKCGLMFISEEGERCNENTSKVGDPLYSKDIPEDKTYLIHFILRRYFYRNLKKEQARYIYELLSGEKSLSIFDFSRIARDRILKKFVSFFVPSKN